MKVSVEELIGEVRVAIDMNRLSEPLTIEGDADALSLDEIIRSKVLEGVRQVHCEAPVDMIDNDIAIPTADHELGYKLYEIEDNGKGRLWLPEDFMRLLCFKMNDWHRTIYEAISTADPIYSLQSSRWKGVYGTPERPVVALTKRFDALYREIKAATPGGTTGGVTKIKYTRYTKLLEFYSCDSTEATIEDARYLPLPEIDEEDSIDIATECRQSIVYRIAWLTLLNVSDQSAPTLLEMSRTELSR